MAPRRRRSLLVPLLVALVPLVLLAGIWLGGHPQHLPGALEGLAGGEEDAALREGLGLIERDYYRRVGRDTLVDDALAGAVEKLDDRFSTYLDPDAYEKFQRTTDGTFAGVGLTVERNRRGLRVVRVFERSPAKRAGLRSGDVIVAVGGRSIAGRPQEESVARIQGKPGTSVRLTWVRGRQRFEKRVERAEIDVPSVESRMRRRGNVKLGWVALSGFTSGAHGEVRQAVDRLLDRGAKGIVLDLRDNGGGLLDEAVLVSSVFIPEGTIVSTDGRTRPKKTYSATGGAIDEDVPVVVLVNRDSASASEIVAGALQDRERAEVIGTRTFGKGVFQEIQRLSNGGALDITVGEYFLPSGRNIGGGGVKVGDGIKPDVSARDRPATERDEALDVALRELARDAT